MALKSIREEPKRPLEDRLPWERCGKAAQNSSKTSLFGGQFTDGDILVMILGF
jgi:hypothetical protein